MAENFLIDSHTVAVEIVLHLQHVLVSLLIYNHLQFELLHLVVTSQAGQIALGKFILYPRTANGQILDFSQSIEYGGLAATVRPQKDVDLVEFELEIDRKLSA